MNWNAERDARLLVEDKLCRLIKALEKLRDEIRSYDNGHGEGDYFADMLKELINDHR